MFKLLRVVGYICVLQLAIYDRHEKGLFSLLFYRSSPLTIAARVSAWRDRHDFHHLHLLRALHRPHCPNSNVYDVSDGAKAEVDDAAGENWAVVAAGDVLNVYSWMPNAAAVVAVVFDSICPFGLLRDAFSDLLWSWATCRWWWQLRLPLLLLPHTRRRRRRLQSGSRSAVARGRICRCYCHDSSGSRCSPAECGDANEVEA